MAEFTALTLRFENCMARHTRVLMQVHHAATVALADEKMLGFPIPYAQYLEALRDTAHDALEEIAGIVRRRQAGRVQ